MQEDGGLTFHARRASEKWSQAAAELDDITEAFQLLDSLEKLLAIFCEANDLLELPPLAIVPVSEQLRGNCKAINKVDAYILELKEQIKSTRASLSRDLASVKVQINKLKRVLATLPHSELGTGTSHQPSKRCFSRSLFDPVLLSNLILFGLDETSTLSDTKATVDEILTFLAGRPVGVDYLVRLGNSDKHPRPDLPAQRPHPVLIKVSTVWDRRLILASKWKLKEFCVSLHYIREDLSPKDRQERARSYKGGNPSDSLSSGLNPSLSSDNLSSHFSGNTRVQSSAPVLSQCLTMLHCVVYHITVGVGTTVRLLFLIF